MKTIFRRTLCCLAIMLCTNLTLLLWATNDIDKMIVISGLVKDSETKKPLASVNIMVSVIYVGTVINKVGRLKLLIPENTNDKLIEISHLGSTKSYISLNTDKLTVLNIRPSPLTN